MANTQLVVYNRKETPVNITFGGELPMTIMTDSFSLSEVTTVKPTIINGQLHMIGTGIKFGGHSLRINGLLAPTSNAADLMESISRGAIIESVECCGKLLKFVTCNSFSLQRHSLDKCAFNGGIQFAYSWSTETN